MWQIERTNVSTFLVDLANKKTTRIRGYVKSKLFFWKEFDMGRYKDVPFYSLNKLWVAKSSSVTGSFVDSLEVKRLEHARSMFLIMGTQWGMFNVIQFSLFESFSRIFHWQKISAKKLKTYHPNLLAASSFSKIPVELNLLRFQNDNFYFCYKKRKAFSFLIKRNFKETFQEKKLEFLVLSITRF